MPDQKPSWPQHLAERGVFPMEDVPVDRPVLVILSVPMQGSHVHSGKFRRDERGRVNYGVVSSAFLFDLRGKALGWMESPLVGPDLLEELGALAVEREA